MGRKFKPGDRVHFRHMTTGEDLSNIYISRGVIQKITESSAVVKEEAGDEGIYTVPLSKLEPVKATK